MSCRRVLVADRVPDTADTLVTLLTLHGLEATAVYTGPDALAAITRDRPDATVLSLDLPGVSGFEVARQVREAGHPVVLIALTGYGDETRVAAVRAAGFDHHLLPAGPAGRPAPAPPPAGRRSGRPAPRRPRPQCRHTLPGTGGRPGIAVPS
ncbi:MAG: response regulator [Gemmataceae bacterium]